MVALVLCGKLFDILLVVVGEAATAVAATDDDKVDIEVALVVVDIVLVMVVLLLRCVVVLVDCIEPLTLSKRDGCCHISCVLAVDIAVVTVVTDCSWLSPT